MTQASAARRRPSHLVPVAVLALAMVGLGLWLSLASMAAPASFTVPLSDVAVQDPDLDGDPATGTWGDALTVEVPLENGAADPYGVATLYVKHDGANIYLRLDGSMDVDWVNTGDDYFWLGIQISPIRTSHHGGTEWDGVFFGFWNGDSYTPQPTYPPKAVDTHGFERPPDPDELQDVHGALGTEGASAPFAFTAEWRRPLSSGDTDDVLLRPDGATTYNFFITTDSDGGGSSGGSISHRQMTNLNVMKLEVSEETLTPPTIIHDPPGDVVAGESLILEARVVDADGVAEVRVNYTDVHGTPWDQAMTLDATLYLYTVPPQNESGTLYYSFWAVDTLGNEAQSTVFSLPVTKLLASPTLDTVEPDGAGCLRLTWTAGGEALFGYRVFRWNTTSQTMEQIAELPPDAVTYEDCSLDADRAYTYWVLSFDEEENQSPPSALISGRTLPEAEVPPNLDVLAVILPIVAVLAGVAVVVVVGRYW